MDSATKMESTLPTVQRPAAIKLQGGFGAGVGAAIVMMLVMAVLRFISNTASIPELMEDGHNRCISLYFLMQPSLLQDFLLQTLVA